MILTNIKNSQKERGFTIVELLVVIVVIGILAAITIVSYTGITQRANTSSAQSAAKAVIDKFEAYQADGTTNAYPLTSSLVTGPTATGTTWALSGVIVNGGVLASAPANPSTVNYYKCVTSGTVSGIAIGYWDYVNSRINFALSGTTGTSNLTAVETAAPTVCTISA